LKGGLNFQLAWKIDAIPAVVDERLLYILTEDSSGAGIAGNTAS
jgi:hypothetical protein